VITSLWVLEVLVCFLMYAVLDGYDLGVGVAVLFERDGGRKRSMVESVAVGWDGNETWLVLGVISLWAGFPLAFGTILPHAYLPLVVVLLSLIVRGVSVELVSQSASLTRRWTTAFGWASLLASFGQGFALGTLTSRGSMNLFCVLSGLAVTAAYLALGYAYTKRKSSGSMRKKAGRRGRIATVVTAALLIEVLFSISATAAPLNLHSPARVFAFAVLLLFAVGGVVAALVTFTRERGGDTVPIGGLIVAVVSVLLAVVVARYPVLLPPDLTVDAAVSPRNTMLFVLIGIGLLNMPLVLAYNVFAHRVFRGKLEGGDS
jgi:cytochrome d ubiquinol oxidase subunit II